MNTIKTKNCVLIAIASTLILSLFFYSGLLSNIQLKLSDNLYGGKTPLDSIIIVAIDDNSLQEIGRWPWNREVFAETIKKLNQSKTIAIDVAFFEPTEQDKVLGKELSEKIIIPVEYTSFAKENGRSIPPHCSRGLVATRFHGVSNTRRSRIRVT